jgi:hypothetical protein
VAIAAMDIIIKKSDDNLSTAKLSAPKIDVENVAIVTTSPIKALTTNVKEAIAEAAIAAVATHTL